MEINIETLGYIIGGIGILIILFDILKKRAQGANPPVSSPSSTEYEKTIKRIIEFEKEFKSELEETNLEIDTLKREMRSLRGLVNRKLPDAIIEEKKEEKPKEEGTQETLSPPAMFGFFK